MARSKPAACNRPVPKIATPARGPSACTVDIGGLVRRSAPGDVPHARPTSQEGKVTA